MFLGESIKHVYWFLFYSPIEIEFISLRDVKVTSENKYFVMYNEVVINKKSSFIRK